MSNTPAISNIKGKLETDQIHSLDDYVKYYNDCGRQDEERKSNADLISKFYDLVTRLYERGWGESFHMAPGWKDESLRESIKRHEHYLALQLGLKQGQKVLDVGCGIGGPMREIARFSSVSITGVNINEYQISRGTELNRIAGVDNTCNFVKADFMKMPFPKSSFDAVYAIEATSHAPDLLGCYKEIYRVLKPGQYFAVYEWCMTDSFDPNNQQHLNIKAEIELGNGLPDIRTTTQCCEAVKLAGFEVIREKDLNEDAPIPWYFAIENSPRFSGIRAFLTDIQIMALEAVGIAPKGTRRVHDFLKKAGQGLVKGGRKGIFTTAYFMMARKPPTDS